MVSVMINEEFGCGEDLFVFSFREFLFGVGVVDLVLDVFGLIVWVMDF